MWCLSLFFLFCFYLQDAAKRQPADIKFTHRPKIRGFHPAGATRCTDSCQTWQDRRPRGSAWLCKISLQSPQGVGMRPQKYQKFPLFDKESSRRGDCLDRFRKFLGAFIRLAIHYHWRNPYLSCVLYMFPISCDSHHRLRSYC